MSSVCKNITCLVIAKQLKKYQVIHIKAERIRFGTLYSFTKIHF